MSRLQYYLWLLPTALTLIWLSRTGCACATLLVLCTCCCLFVLLLLLLMLLLLLVIIPINWGVCCCFCCCWCCCNCCCCCSSSWFSCCCWRNAARFALALSDCWGWNHKVLCKINYNSGKLKKQISTILENSIHTQVFHSVQNIKTIWYNHLTIQYFACV